jgi:hypothetical protein
MFAPFAFGRKACGAVKPVNGPVKGGMGGLGGIGKTAYLQPCQKGGLSLWYHLPNKPRPRGGSSKAKPCFNKQRIGDLK